MSLQNLGGRIGTLINNITVLEMGEIIEGTHIFGGGPTYQPVGSLLSTPL